MSRQYDVIGVQEYSSIALGVQALDAMVKAAPVEVITTRLVEPEIGRASCRERVCTTV